MRPREPPRAQTRWREGLLKRPTCRAWEGRHRCYRTGKHPPRPKDCPGLGDPNTLKIDFLNRWLLKSLAFQFPQKSMDRLTDGKFSEISNGKTANFWMDEKNFSDRRMEERKISRTDRPQFHVQIDLNFTSRSISISLTDWPQLHVQTDLNFTSRSTSISHPDRPRPHVLWRTDRPQLHFQIDLNFTSRRSQFHVQIDGRRWLWALSMEIENSGISGTMDSESRWCVFVSLFSTSEGLPNALTANSSRWPNLAMVFERLAKWNLRTFAQTFAIAESAACVEYNKIALFDPSRRKSFLESIDVRSLEMAFLHYVTFARREKNACFVFVRICHVCFKRFVLTLCFYVCLRLLQS